MWKNRIEAKAIRESRATDRHGKPFHNRFKTLANVAVLLVGILLWIYRHVSLATCWGHGLFALRVFKPGLSRQASQTCRRKVLWLKVFTESSRGESSKTFDEPRWRLGHHLTKENHEKHTVNPPCGEPLQTGWGKRFNAMGGAIRMEGSRSGGLYRGGIHVSQRFPFFSF